MDVPGLLFFTRTNMILTKEQVEELTTAQCEAAIKALDSKYNLDKFWKPEYADKVDDIANTLLYLEDRIKSIKISESAYNARMSVLEKKQTEE